LGLCFSGVPEIRRRNIARAAEMTVGETEIRRAFSAPLSPRESLANTVNMGLIQPLNMSLQGSVIPGPERGAPTAGALRPGLGMAVARGRSAESRP
jgi:hypothetical protein